MPAPAQSNKAQPMTLDSAKVLHVDTLAATRTQLEQVLRGIGFEQITACETLEEFPDKLVEAAPDLVFVDIDCGPDWTFDTIRGIPACAANAPGSCRRSDVIGHRGLDGPCSSDPWARSFSDCARSISHSPFIA